MCFDLDRVETIMLNMACVLLVEDDIDLRFSLAGILARAGHHVIEADDGEDGVAQIAKKNPDVVISDMVMDGMEGISTVLNIRNTHPELPILAISGSALYLNNAEKLGANASLQKPFSSEAFMNAVNALLISHAHV